MKKLFIAILIILFPILLFGQTIEEVAPLPSCNTDWYCGGVADFDLDGIPDILWRHCSGANAIWYMQADGTSIKFVKSLPSCSLEWAIAGVADFNGDRYPDILWRNINGQNAIWYLTDDGIRIKEVSGFPACNTSWEVMRLADFNADGLPDVLWRNVNGANARWNMLYYKTVETSTGAIGVEWEAPLTLVSGEPVPVGTIVAYDLFAKLATGGGWTWYLGRTPEMSYEDAVIVTTLELPDTGKWKLGVAIVRPHYQYSVGEGDLTSEVNWSIDRALNADPFVVLWQP